MRARQTRVAHSQSSQAPALISIVIYLPSRRIFSRLIKYGVAKWVHYKDTPSSAQYASVVFVCLELLPYYLLFCVEQRRKKISGDVARLFRVPSERLSGNLFCRVIEVLGNVTQLSAFSSGACASFAAIFLWSPALVPRFGAFILSLSCRRNNQFSCALSLSCCSW